MFAGIEIHLNCPQFRQMVPESEIYYLDPDSLSLYNFSSDYFSLGIVSVSRMVVYNVNLFKKILLFICRRLLQASLLIHLTLRQQASQL